MMRKRIFIFVFALVGVVACANRSLAVIAMDVASNSPYNPANSWSNGQNGGSGFGAWSLATSGTPAGFFIGDSTGLSGGSGADINSSGESFGMFAGDSNGDFESAEAIRSFSADLGLGQAFSMDIAVNFRNGNKGVDVRNSGGTTIFNFNVGADNYVVNAATTGNGSIGSSYSANTEFQLTFTQTSTTGGTWLIARSGGVTDSDGGTYTGIPAGFKLYVNNTDGGSPNDLFANNFLITAVPEAPAVWFGALASAALGVVWARPRVRDCIFSRSAV